MIVKNVLIRLEGLRNANISWISENEKSISWICINGRLAFGPLMADTKERNVVLPVPQEGTFKIEVHDFDDYDEVPAAFEEAPLVEPTLAWSKVDTAVCYRIYHTIFDTKNNGTIESKLVEIPATPMDRIEINCPAQLEGRGGRWHLFRIEAVDQFGNESENHQLAFFAADFPMPPTLTISRSAETGLLNFRIES